MAHRSYCKLLFGGALFCAGQHAGAAGAQVSDASFTFRGEVGNVFELAYVGPPYGYDYIDTGLNESFEVSGGFGLLPFSRTAEGGFVDGNNYSLFPRQVVSASGDGSLSASGSFEFSGAASAYAGLSFPADPNFDVNAGVRIEFTVTSPSEYQLAVVGSFDNDLGSSGLSLERSDGAVIFRPSGFLFFDETDSGVLQPDTYTLSFGASGSGEVSASFSVVPSPGAASVLAVAGLAAARRRRIG